MQIKKYEISVGIIVVIAIVAIIFGNILFSERKTSAGYYDITVNFSQVGGLEIGSNVYVNGVKVGNVKLIQLNHNDVTVTISIANEIKLVDSAQIFVQESGLMGDRKINILQGDSDTILKKKKNLQGMYMPGINETSSNINQVVDELHNAISAFSKRDVEKLRKNLTKLDNLLTNLNLLFEPNGKVANVLHKSDTLLTSMKSAVDDNSQGVKKIVDKTHTRLEEMKKLFNNLNLLISRLNQPDTDFGKFTGQDSLYIKFNKTISNLDSLMRDIKKNPGRYFSIF